jgi:lipopolysaccharide transport system permease protein
VAASGAPRRRVKARSATERLAELFAYRHLVTNLVRRDLTVRYKNSLLGFMWSLVGPLLMIAVFYVVFSVLLKQEIRDYAVFLLVALLPWNWFAVSVAGGLRSITNNASLVTKVYFPREALPLSLVSSEMVNFLLALPVLFLVMYVTGNPLTIHALWLPVIIGIQLIFTLGLVLVLSTANVYYRDTGVIMEVVLLAWFFLTPVFYSLEPDPGAQSAGGLFGDDFPMRRLVYVLNPMASLVANYRVILYGSPNGPPSAPALDFLFRTAVTAVVTLIIGYAVFARHAGRFAEEV